MGPKRNNSQKTLSFSVTKKNNSPANLKHEKPSEKKSYKQSEPVEVIETKGSQNRLNPDDPTYEEYYEQLTRNEISEPMHYEDYNAVDKLLRQFDFASEYGPVSGLSRLERWERAAKLGKNPPEIVRHILLTKEGQNDSRYSQSYLYNHI